MSGDSYSERQMEWAKSPKFFFANCFVFVEGGKEEKGLQESEVSE